MTADPNIVPGAYPITHLSYMEALELSTYGAVRIPPEVLVPLIDARIPIRIRCLGAPPGVTTWVDAPGAGDEQRPTSVCSLRRQTLIDVQLRRPARMEELPRLLDQSAFRIALAIETVSGQGLSFVVPAADADRARQVIEAALEPWRKRLEVESIIIREPVSVLTLVAEAMGQRAQLAGRFFGALGEIGVNVLAIGQSASSRSISCVIAEEHTTSAVRTVHDAFNFAHQTVNVFVLGRGVVGGELIDQIRAQGPVISADHGIELVLVGIKDSQRLWFDENGLELPDDWRERLGPEGEEAGAQLGETALLALRRLPVPVLVDCTAAEDMAPFYHRVFGHGIHVVAANKKPLTIDQRDRDLLMKAARRHYRAYHYETTVGASLPVIETLKDLVRTGDRVQLIEGSFSGTLGYLTHALSGGTPLAEAVRTAQSLGYTEPQPQDDLSGRDAARKALILARELGLSIDMDDVKLVPLVPSEILVELDEARFYRALEAYQQEMAARIEGLRAQGQVLRYLARIDPEAASRGEPVLSVGPVGVPLDHPAASLQGSEAIVAFTTARYQAYPLIVRGAGAGGSVTAAGVLADILRVAQRLRGR
jgi:aspartokinase/homoserine dehydrogenase 1